MPGRPPQAAWRDIHYLTITSTINNTFVVVCDKFGQVCVGAPSPAATLWQRRFTPLRVNGPEGDGGHRPRVAQVVVPSISAGVVGITRGGRKAVGPAALAAAQRASQMALERVCLPPRVEHRDDVSDFLAGRLAG